MIARKRLLPILIALLMVFAMMPMIAARVYAEGSVPEPDITYTSDSDWEGTLVINENTTIELNGVTHDNSGISY